MDHNLQELDSKHESRVANFTVIASFTVGFDIVNEKRELEFTGVLSDRTPSVVIANNSSYAELLNLIRFELCDFVLDNTDDNFVPISSVYIFLSIVKINGSEVLYNRASRIWALGISEIRREFISLYGQEEYDKAVRYHNKIKLA